MKIRISKDLYVAVGKREFQRYHVEEEAFRWNKETELDIALFTPMQALDLKALVSPHSKLRLAKQALRDLDTLINALKAGDKGVLKNTHAFFLAAQRYFMKAEVNQRLYRLNTDKNIWQAWWCGRISFSKQERTRNGIIPARTNLVFYATEFGEVTSTHVDLENPDVAGFTVAQALAKAGWVPETEELRAEYLAARNSYVALVDSIGQQHLATGSAESESARSGNWWSSRNSSVHLDKDGEPAHVVIDVFSEDDRDGRSSSRDAFDPTYWVKMAKGMEPDEDGEIEEEDEVAAKIDEALEAPAIELPIIMNVMVFDLKRHMRLQVHATQLARYGYDASLGDKLILPAETRVLIDILLRQAETQFKDIIAGKGGGAVILSVGPPGTGKTLTAEAYAEVAERPLYSVQCSQLGTTSEDLEKSLLQIFARAARWNAICLLDEADVYIRERGDDIEQNAIVGVFLRTLEYYKGTLFLTTNRPEAVDDAIASRCVARVQYKLPTPADQARIWRVLADVSGASISNAVIKEFSKAHTLSGRDVKNILKLATLFTGGKPITAKVLETVKVFKPTADISISAGAPAVGRAR